MAFEIPYHISHIETQYDINLFNRDILNQTDKAENDKWETLCNFPKEIKVWCEDTDNKKYLLYHCEYLKIEKIGYNKYVGYNVKCIDPSNQKERSDNIFVENINEWIRDIVFLFKHGKLTSNKFATYYISIFKRMRLNYRQVKAILTFEHNASRSVGDKPKAVITKDPTDIDPTIPLQLDKYIIESDWLSPSSDKSKYSCVTNDETMLDWLTFMILRY